MPFKMDRLQNDQKKKTPRQMYPKSIDKTGGEQRVKHSKSPQIGRKKSSEHVYALKSV